MRLRKPLTIAIVTLGLYVGLVVLFESMLGFFQPEAGNTQLITTFDGQGAEHERVVARLESDGTLYVAANHWPRAWYRQALATPRMEVQYENQSRSYRVVAVERGSAEFERVDNEHGLGPVFRFLTGFPPRRLVRLEPL